MRHPRALGQPERGTPALDLAIRCWGKPNYMYGGPSRLGPIASGYVNSYVATGASNGRKRRAKGAARLTVPSLPIRGKGPSSAVAPIHANQAAAATLRPTFPAPFVQKE